MADLNEQMRAEFEAWYLKHNPGFESWMIEYQPRINAYKQSEVDLAWDVWQAARRQHGSAVQAVAKVRSKFGDPEAFGEREIVALDEAAVQKLPYGTVLYAVPAGGNSR